MIRIAHFTDMHLRHHQPGTADDPLRLSREMPALLDRFAKRLKDDAPDALVMSGDVLDMPDEVVLGGTPDERSHENWMADADADFRLVRDWFKSTGIPYVAVPGNHDHEGAFATVFGDNDGPVDIAGLRFFCFWDPLADDKQPLRNGERAAHFETAMTAPEHDCPQVHVHHYMIAPATFAKNKHYQYKTAPALLDALGRSGRVRAVLSGHHHPGTLIEQTRKGDTVHSGAPAFCETPHPYRLYDLAADGTTTVIDRTVDG
jgi:3',5'-cyclic AMP phosphodiesterase CpdA